MAAHVLEVLDGALAGCDGLDEEAKHGEHGQTAILDLLDLQAMDGWMSAQAGPRPL